MLWTNRGKYLVESWAFRGATRPTNFYIALVTAAAAPTADTNTLSQLTEIAAGNGYTAGGYQLTPGTTDFDVLTENDTDDRGELQLKDIAWNASGGPIPASGGGARYAVLLTDEATVANRQVICSWDLASDRVVSSGQPLTLQNCEIRIG